MTISYRGNLSSTVFPMTLADAGRSVIIPQADQNYDRRIDPAGEKSDAGIPQAMYLQDVLPTVHGYQSVGYKESAGGAMPPRASGTGTTVIVRTFVVALPTLSSPAILIQREGTSSYHDVIGNNITASLAWQYQVGAVRPVAGSSPPSVAVVRGIG